MHQIPKLKYFSSCLAVVFAQSIEAIVNEDVVGATPTGNAPTTSEWSTILLPTTVRLILEIWPYPFCAWANNRPNVECYNREREWRMYIYPVIHSCMYGCIWTVYLDVYTFVYTCVTFFPVTIETTLKAYFRGCKNLHPLVTCATFSEEIHTDLDILFSSW